MLCFQWGLKGPEDCIPGRFHVNCSRETLNSAVGKASLTSTHRCHCWS